MPRSFTQIAESRNGKGNDGSYINMGASDLQRLIQKIKSERTKHLETLNRIDYPKLKDINKITYVPVQKTTAELMKEVSYKKSWRAPGLVNKEFSEIPVLKPVVLDQWTRSRVQMPFRSYEKFALSKNHMSLN